MAIEGKVAKILDLFSVVINVGNSDGVRTGMNFVIYQTGAEIKDPDTKEDLGPLMIVKAKLRVLSVQETMSVAETSDRVEVPSPWLLPELFMGSRGRRKPLPLSASVRETLEETFIKPVDVGDPVREVD